ncbi:hypothetical protein [Halobacillus yeomjeoni]|uniref:Uncharacterized protein n=1 Tax=Halobacillus yeomjeoni TaxID=311194 RepID=A0A931MTM7_9BACI|nr:hypothetical protein [Halobacillus yeomjeoni]MBH0228600.1 hypothetical protein [Halobacillus yeomjeoni]
MSSFIKGTSVVGILVVGIGLWQINEYSRQGSKEQVLAQSPSPPGEHKSRGEGHSYDFVTIETDSYAVPLERPDYDGQKLVNEDVVEAIEHRVEENERILFLIKKIGEDWIEDRYASGRYTYEWDKLKESNEIKRKMIEELLSISTSPELNTYAKQADRNFSRALRKKDLNYYFEATKHFMYLSEEFGIKGGE